MDITPRNELDEAKYKEILSIWNCFVCKKTPEQPVQISICRHMFCYNCVLHVRVCPKCGAQYHKKDISFFSFLADYTTLCNKVNTVFQSAKSIPDKSEVKEEANLENIKKDTGKESEETVSEMERRVNLAKIYNRFYNPQSKNRSGSNDSKSKVDSNVKQTNAQTSDPKPSVSSEVGSSKFSIINNNQKKTPRSKLLENKIKIKVAEVKRNSRGETRLHTACVRKDIQTVKQLLENGDNPNVKDFAGWNPLTEAVCKGDLPLADLLLKHGAWVNMPAVLNTTSLLEAVTAKNVEMVKLLLMHGADVNSRSKLDNTPLSWAKNEESIYQVLLNHKPESTEPHEIIPPFNPESFTGICCDVIDVTKRNEIFHLCEELGFFVQSEFRSDVSHIVTLTDENFNCECSIIILRSILNGLSIVSNKWLLECYDKKKVVPIQDYEVQGTKNYPNTGVPRISRLNAYRLNPKLFDGCHISLTGAWQDFGVADISKELIISLIRDSGAVYLLRDPDPEEIPENETTIMYHTRATSPMFNVSHIILYQPNTDPKKEPLLKYNMKHVKTLPTTWFLKCIHTFSICDP